jgi:hypothetical protein
MEATAEETEGRGGRGANKSRRRAILPQEEVTSSRGDEEWYVSRGRCSFLEFAKVEAAISTAMPSSRLEAARAQKEQQQLIDRSDPWSQFTVTTPRLLSCVTASTLMIGK